ncbi:MAG: 2-oxoglutarate dehydrogenase complex dihydrolipoyllysine-residue succinyltransferase [Proteobacteria bacterium]|nr:2-oxoglutarate dehydrogenase complex dihydrolipoyllysine-residue succinyltransferase [Cystobacterineae bacterium]MCL2259563.1 2-oxoglutarate dehydrogenase complex dihydrolipoyllysine-residue succinyltransferase [Cystobacterineae bacterium]MCL2313972.1 2-oxoglutarate dehydrogenase complex dihydrolipoyllysine-residue succinyltransferase [Pseudomonadota bacterium]
MPVELKVPVLGESISEAVVSKWNKKVGDTVAMDETLVSLETDKISIDVVAPSAGTLASIAFPEGSKVKIGDVLGTIAEGTTTDAMPPGAPSPSASLAQRTPPITPVAQRMAEATGVDISKIQGSGAQGRILKEDVAKAGAPSPATQPTSPPTGAPPGPNLLHHVPPLQREERVPLTPLRKRVAERLLQAQSQAAILTTFNEVDMGEVVALRKNYGEAFLKKHGVKLGYMGFFVKAAVEALRAFPQVNSSMEGDTLVFKRYYDIGVAVSGSRGLVVPVIRDAQQQSLAELEKTIADFGERARNEKLVLSELQGGTFTISNGGIFGSMLSTPILNPPQTAILGMHNIVERAVVKNGQVVIRPVMYLALSYDHRVIDGREAVLFLVRIKECIEAPQRMLLDA